MRFYFLSNKKQDCVLTLLSLVFGSLPGVSSPLGDRPIDPERGFDTVSSANSPLGDLLRELDLERGVPDWLLGPGIPDLKGALCH